MRLMLAQSVRLLLALGTLWCVLVAPAYLVAGTAAVVGLSAAVLLCFLPGVAVLGLQTGPLAGQQPMTGLLLGMGLRMAVVLAAVLAVRQALPGLPATVFLAWLVPAYLVALTVETRLALASPSGRSGIPLRSARMRVTGSH